MDWTVKTTDIEGNNAMSCDSYYMDSLLMSSCIFLFSTGEAGSGARGSNYPQVTLTLQGRNPVQDVQPAIRYRTPAGASRDHG